MEYRPYKLLNATELAEIGKQAEAAFSTWVSDWLGVADMAMVECRRAAEFDMTNYPEKSNWTCIGADREEWIALARTAAFTAQLRTRLIPDQHTPANSAATEKSPMLSDLLESALTDFLRMFAAAPAQAHQVPAERFRDIGSGAAVAEIDWKEAKLALVISPPLVASMLSRIGPRAARKGSLVKVNEALANGRMNLKVMVGEAEVELGLLQTIAVGDVIKLNTRVDEPLQVVTADGLRLCRAFLGIRNGRKSIQLST
jgi:flagellar motor switch/type III secretory pathway protein FliN